jgi:deazaflavin-dependent oxidoreductase (nitroreductase family)
MNKQVLKEFRENGGKVGGMFEGAPLLILTTTGAKSGKTRETPLMYRPDGDRFIIFASMAGAPTNPSWYYNVKANSDVTVEVGSERFAARARELPADEREGPWEAQKAEVPQFAEYEKQANRVIPLVELTRA